MSSSMRQSGQLCDHEIHDEREKIYEEMVRRGGDMTHTELRLRLLSKVGESIRVPTDQSWTSNSEGFTILRTAHRNASSQLQAYVRRLLQKRFTRSKGVAACQHILDHIQLLVQKGQAGVLEAYGEGVMALLDRPH